MEQQEFLSPEEADMKAKRTNHYTRRNWSKQNALSFWRGLILIPIYEQDLL